MRSPSGLRARPLMATSSSKSTTRVGTAPALLGHVAEGPLGLDLDDPTQLRIEDEHAGGNLGVRPRLQCDIEQFLLFAGPDSSFW